MMNVSSISPPSGEGKKKTQNGVIFPDFQEDVKSDYLGGKKEKNNHSLSAIISN